MVPLRVGAMESFFEKKKEEAKSASATTAAAREHEREATESDEDVEESFTPSFATFGTEVPNSENTTRPQGTSFSGLAVAVVAGNRRQQDQISRASGGSSSLQHLDPVTQVHLANIERVKSQSSALIERAKKINPEFGGIIDEWHQSDDPETRVIILNTQILAPAAPQAEGVQRNEIAALLGRVAKMEESVAQMEQVGIDKTWKEVETMAPATIVQVPSPRVRAEQTLQALQRENGVQQEAVNTLIRLTQASKTMVCLKALDFITFPMSPIAVAFITANHGADWGSIPLILNNSERPVRFIIPASEGQLNYTLVPPTIIPAGTRTIVDGVRTTAPTRVPSAEESRQVRTLIMEALQVYFGPEVRECFPDFDKDDRPLMAGEISGVFATMEEKYQENKNQNGTATTEAPQIPASLRDIAENLALSQSNEAKQLEAQALFEKGHKSLTRPLDGTLARAAWYAGETVVRSAGVVAGTIAGLSSKVGRGVLVGAAIPATFAVGGAIGARAGAFVGNIVGLDEREANQTIIGSYLALAAVPFVPHASLLAAAAAISSFGAVGGAAASVYHALPASAEGVLNHYSPGLALEKMKEALRDWSGATVTHTLTLMQQAQETDLEAMEALHDFFESFVQVENAASAAKMQCNLSSVSSSSASRSSSPALDVEKTRVNERAITPETLTPARARDILINQIKLRILYREDLMMRLQNKAESVKAIEQQAEQQSRATFQSSDFRTRYPRGL